MKNNEIRIESERARLDTLRIQSGLCPTFRGNKELDPEQREIHLQHYAKCPVCNPMADPKVRAAFAPVEPARVSIVATELHALEDLKDCAAKAVSIFAFYEADERTFHHQLAAEVRPALFELKAILANLDVLEREAQANHAASSSEQPCNCDACRTGDGH